jgi:hypothetical protein
VGNTRGMIRVVTSVIMFMPSKLSFDELDSQFFLLQAFQ